MARLVAPVLLREPSPFEQGPLTDVLPALRAQVPIMARSASLREEQLRQERQGERMTNASRNYAALDALLDLRVHLSVAIDAIQENEHLRKDRDYWQKMYNDSLSQSIKHSEAMMGNVLTAILAKPKVSA